ncbi:hypothetical protein GMMP15_1090002 [Candidatus Magnetomoraceae bacterium gMMP-15]
MPLFADNVNEKEFQIFGKGLLIKLRRSLAQILGFMKYGG